MGDQDSPKTAVVTRHIDVILVILGQVLVLLLFLAEQVSGYLIVAAMASNAAGLGIRAKRTGRSVSAWVVVGCLFPLVVPVIAIAVMVYRKKRSPAEGKPVSIYGHTVMAVLIFVLSAVFMDSLSFGIVCTAVAVIWVLSGRRSTYTKKQIMVRIGVYIAALAMIFVMKAGNNRISQRNAGVIIAACDEYLKKNGTYPDSLKDLVPAYLPEVPAARYTWISNGFIYRKDRGQTENGYVLIYTVEAPFARNVYSGARKTWRRID